MSDIFWSIFGFLLLVAPAAGFSYMMASNLRERHNDLIRRREEREARQRAFDARQKAWDEGAPARAAYLANLKARTKELEDRIEEMRAKEAFDILNH